MGGAPRNPSPRNHFLAWIVKPSGCHCAVGHFTSRVSTVESRPPLGALPLSPMDAGSRSGLRANSRTPAAAGTGNPRAALGWHYLSNATCLMRPHLCCVFRRDKDHRILLQFYSPLLKKACLIQTSSVRQVVPPEACRSAGGAGNPRIGDRGGKMLLLKCVFQRRQIYKASKNNSLTKKSMF